MFAANCKSDPDWLPKPSRACAGLGMSSFAGLGMSSFMRSSTRRCFPKRALACNDVQRAIRAEIGEDRLRRAGELGVLSLICKRTAGATLVSWVYVAATVSCTVYGQLTVKWRVSEAGEFPTTHEARCSLPAVTGRESMVISAFAAAFAAALAWMAPMTRLELSRAYPFVTVSFVLVLMASGILFGERLTLAKAAGVGLILLGLAVGSST